MVFARHGDMSQEFQVDILRPFGPRILRAKMPMEYVNALNEQCDKILQDDNKRKELDESAGVGWSCCRRIKM